jgi:hypothetical protein
MTHSELIARLADLVHHALVERDAALKVPFLDGAILAVTELGRP